MFEIKNLHVNISEVEKIINGINLKINPGEVHAIMGPNGLESLHYLILYQVKKVMKLKKVT